uniref:43kDa secreted glycoprotein (Immunodominant antigen Gp43) n=1 Tax=Ganoderma boninense TaxID=34458 RepID=A0A5K1JSD7_9APHY
MPGYIYPPLSVKNLIPPAAILDVDPVPWSEELRKNGAEDVLCLPFSLTPFPLIEAVRSISLADANISNVLRFEPSSVESSMMAAYPILLPIYLAQFDVNTVVDGKIVQVTATAFMDASYDAENPRVMVEVTQGVIDFFKMFDLPVPDLVIRGQHANSVRQFAVIRSLLAGHASLNHKRRLERWIDKAGASSDNLPAYRNRYFGKTEQEAARMVNWDDIRIRPFTREEREANWQYMTAGEELFFVKQLALTQERNREIVGSSGSGLGDPASTALLDPVAAENLQNHTAAAEKKREEMKPDWLAQYEIQRRLSAGMSGSDVAESSSSTGESNTGGKSSAGDTSSAAGIES